MFISPLPSQASELNAGMVDLQSKKDLNELAKVVASSSTSPRAPSKKIATKNSSKTTAIRGMEIRSRRILKGELVNDIHYPLLETTINLSLAVMVGLASRWVFGLLRSLRLSLVPSDSTSIGGRGGPCCSPYTGGEDDLPGSFERLLACVLIKKEGDDAGNFLFTLLVLIFSMNVVKLAWSVSSLHTPEAESSIDDSDSVNSDDRIERTRNKSETQVFRRVHPQKIKRILVGCGSVLSSFWFFHTPALLRVLGLDALTKAMEEISARILLFGNLAGILSLSSSSLVGGVETLMTVCFAFLAVAWGFVASVMTIPIRETARNAAHLMSPNFAKKTLNPSEMMDLINVRMMLIIQAVTPVLIMCTYFLNSHFVESTKKSARSGQMKMTFSKQFLQNSGLFVRVVLAWCFVAACAYCFRSMLQSYLDQATSVASATGIAKDDDSFQRGSAQSSFRTSDPFNDRYKNIVLTAGRITAFPALMLALLAIAHIRGGDGSIHPGVKYQSQPFSTPRLSIPEAGLLPSYSSRFLTWTFNRDQRFRGEAKNSAGDGLLQAAAFSLSEIDESSFRDSIHTTVASWLGNNRICFPPKIRSVKSLIRHVQFILDETYGELFLPIARTGRELLDLAPKVPVTFVDTILGSKPAHGSCVSKEEDPNEVCVTSMDPSLQRPSFFEMLMSMVSHQFFTPTVVFPIIDTLAFLCSVWWSYWYSFQFAIYCFKLRSSSCPCI
jgi:hypothetical protein